MLGSDAFPYNRTDIQGSGNKEWNGTGGSGLIWDKSLERCNRTALPKKICCNGELPLEPHLEFVTGRGGAGFHSPGPALTTGRGGGYFGGDPRPAPVRGESPLILWMGPRFSPPVLTGTRLGNGRGRGQGQGTVK